MATKETKHTREEEVIDLTKKRKRNRILNVITFILVLAGLIWGLTFFLRYVRFEITNDATVEQYVTPINSRVQGYIKTVGFTDHQWVDKGDTLILIDDSEFKIHLMTAEAALMDAKSSSTVLSSSIASAQTNVDVSDANIAEAKARLWQAGQDLKRYENLLATQSVSQQQYDQMKSNFDAENAHYNALLHAKKASESTSDEVSKKRGNAAAAILGRQADLDMAKLNLSYTVITAPYSGYVGRRTLEPGQLVQAGQTITDLISADNKWIIANYRERQIEKIHIGQKVKVTVDAIHGKTFTGTVTAISEATGAKYSMLPTDNSAGNFVKIQQRIPVRIDFTDISEEDMHTLRAGMMAICAAEKH